MSEALTPEPSTTGAVRRETGTPLVKRGLAEMLKGGVIMDVVNADEARIAEDAGATAVMALERVPSDIRRDGGVARMSDPEMIEGIKAAVTIPVMAKAHIGHFVEAQVLQALGVDYVDESEVLTPADESHHIDKWAFTVPFVCGATNLGEALRRISEGACMIRSKGEAGTGNVVEAVRHLRSILGDIRKIGTADSAELFEWAKRLQAPLPLVQEIAETGKLQVPLFCAGGLATPADAALAMQLGAEAVFVGSGIFKSADPAPRAKARIGHFVEAQVLQALGVDYVDESEVLTPADEVNHIDKHAFKVPYVCGCRNLGEALRRINEGAAMMRTKGEAGTGNVVEAVRQLRDVLAEIRRLGGLREDELFVAAKELQAPYELVKQVAAEGRLPVVNFVAGGISTPADAALVMQLGAEGVFVGSGIFKSEDPARMANAIVQATTHFQDAKILAEVSKGLGAPMRGIAMEAIPPQERMAVRGW